jgi:hypothetical protein
MKVQAITVAMNPTGAGTTTVRVIEMNTVTRAALQF